MGRELDGEGDEGEKGQEEKKSECGGGEADQLAGELLRGQDAEAFAVEEGGGAQAIELDLAVEPFAECAVLLDGDATEAEFNYDKAYGPLRRKSGPR